MMTSGYAPLSRFVRGLLLLDVAVAVLVEILSLALDLHSFVAYATLLVWAGLGLVVLAALLSMGGLSARLQDVNAFHLSRAGDMTENLHQVAEAGRSSLGCSLLLLLAGLSLLAIGDLLKFLSAYFN